MEIDREILTSTCCLFCRYGRFTVPIYSTDNGRRSAFKCGKIMPPKTIAEPEFHSCETFKNKKQ